MERAQLVFLQMIIIILNIIAMALILTTDAHINTKILIDLILGVSTAMLLFLAWRAAAHKI